MRAGWHRETLRSIHIAAAERPPSCAEADLQIIVSQFGMTRVARCVTGAVLAQRLADGLLHLSTLRQLEHPLGGLADHRRVAVRLHAKLL
jgi:hypothetical protein